VKSKNFDYNTCKELILKGILESINDKKDEILAFPKHPIGTSTIKGMSLDIFPWHNLVQISFCDDADSFKEEHIAEWKYFNFVSSNEDNYHRSLELAANYISSFWEGSDEEDEDDYFIERRLRAHIIFLAGAEAILDKSVSELLLDCGLDQCKYSEHPFDTGRFFLVCDDDQTLSANYCEIVKSNIAVRLFFSELEEAKSF